MCANTVPGDDGGEITYEILYRALKNSLGRRGMEDKEIERLAEYIINFFGFEDRVLDNVLTADDRDVFYMLADIGILGTDNEEVTVKKGKLWRIHYWVLKKDNILRLANQEVENEEEDAHTIYEHLADDIWAHRPHE